MAFRPPEGVNPPQFEGKRTGRPKGSMNYKKALPDVAWGYEHRLELQIKTPNAHAGMWRTFAYFWPKEVAWVLRWNGYRGQLWH